MLTLVTGANGFIGQRLVRRLLDEGRSVRALVLPGEDVSAIAGAEVVRGDVRDAGAMAEVMKGVAEVHHLAAIVGDWGDERLFRAVNVDGTRHLLDAAEREGTARFVMVSSIVVYGSQLYRGHCVESAPREHGVSPYSRTKRASEELALDYHRRGRVPVTVVRPGNVYGPGPGIWVDEVIKVLRSGRGILIDKGVGDATLAHVDNVVEVMMLAAAAECSVGRIYNANDGAGITWREYMGDLARMVGVKPPTRSIPRVAAMALAVAMERTYALLRRTERPLLTRENVTLMASKRPVPVERATVELGYSPVVSYGDALDAIAAYVHGGVA